MTEYFAMPEATEHAFRGGWFHTGDVGRVDSDGYLYFVARRREVIRRRGENIAATDVEEAVDAHVDVRESAAVGVPSELSEDDIKVFVVAQPGAQLHPVTIVEHCRFVLPAHMVPRYVEIVADLPKTPTEKIERFRLAALPNTAQTWDVEARAATRRSAS
jgi:crotonobetaine/carnitine-CoA ligase